MKLRDALRQVELEQPHLTGTAKLEAIKALREQAKPTTPAAQEPSVERATPDGERPPRRPVGVGEAWGFFIFIALGMQLIPYLVWGSAAKAPHWYDVLHAALLISAVAELISAYRNRGSRNS